MGNAPSLLFGDTANNHDSTSGPAPEMQDRDSPEPTDDKSAARDTSEQSKERLNEFKLELARKHEKRRQILEGKRREMEELREEVVRLKRENQELKENEDAGGLRKENESLVAEVERLRKENEGLREISQEKSKLLEATDDVVARNREMRVSIAEMQRELQELNKQVVGFETEREDYRAHVVALKDVIAVSKNMLQIRESQLKELKQKIESIEESLAGREMNILSQDLKNEYERQLQNIRNLRTLYEERQRVHKREKEELVSQLEDAKKDVAAEQTRASELEERITALEEDNSKKYDEIKALESNLGLSKAESRQYQAELTVINQLFSEILLGFNSSQDIDLDKLQRHLEDHRDLLQNIVVNEISPEVSYALPKVLLELLNEVNDQETKPEAEEAEMTDGKLETIKEESESQTSSIHQMKTAEEIVEDLPKVWKVLIELLSHQKAPMNYLTDDQEAEDPCYKTIQTPKGPSLVLSVSQTFIRLKDLILEKKSLEKETNHLKQLNGHLENRLQDQEKRLELVQSELSKTWLVVGKLQKQHQMLHTQEKILRYELAQKRKLLTELKEQLEYSREKWTQAREKNSNTEQQWQQLRTEFASRRNTVVNDNSVESGYSDDRESSSSDEEPGYETDSECVQKASGSDDVEDLSEMVSVCEDSGSDLHSDKKTDSVQNPDCAEQTEECRIVPEEEEEEKKVMTNQEERPDVAGSSKELPHDEECSIVTELSAETSEENVQASKKTDDGSTTVEEDDKLQELVAKSQEAEIVPDSSVETTQQEDRRAQTLEEVLAQRDERLKRLEGQAEQLVTKVTNTAIRSVVISNRLDDLHGVYGQSSNGQERAPAETVVVGDDEVPAVSDDLVVSLTEDNQE